MSIIGMAELLQNTPVRVYFYCFFTYINNLPIGLQRIGKTLKPIFLQTIQ